MSSEENFLTADQEKAWRSLIVIWRVGFARLDRTFRKFGLIHLEYGILSVLTEAPEGTMPAGELAEIAGLSTSHLSHRIKVMEERGYVTRGSGVRDGRVVLVSITPEGRELRERVAPVHRADVTTMMFDALDARQTAQLADELSAVARALTDHPFATGGEPGGASVDDSGPPAR